MPLQPSLSLMRFAAWCRDTRRQELHSPLSSTIADLAETDRRAVEAAAEIPPNKIWDHASTNGPPLRGLIHRHLSVSFEQSAETACASRYYVLVAGSQPDELVEAAYQAEETRGILPERCTGNMRDRNKGSCKPAGSLFSSMRRHPRL